MQQRFEERAAMHRQPLARTAAQRAIAHIKHNTTRWLHASEQPPDRRAERTQPIAHADLVKHGEPNRLENEARADRRWRLHAVMNDNPGAFARDQRRACKPGYSPTCNRD
jgi:hypothetical protein